MKETCFLGCNSSELCCSPWCWNSVGSISKSDFQRIFNYVSILSCVVCNGETGCCKSRSVTCKSEYTWNLCTRNHTGMLLWVKTHRRVAIGNTKSREVAGALAGTAPSSTARNPGTRRGFLRRRACHLTYTRSGRCKRASNDLPAYTNTWKRKSEP